MPKRLAVTLVLLLFCFRAYAALPTATAWEIRTLGNANNGGCYVTGSTGTDFSQQNAAQYTFTDLVLVTATTATSVSHLFVATDVGNCLHITAGTNFTQGFYQIVSVSTGTATLDRAAGTMGSTGGTYAVGGAITLPSSVNTAAQPGNQVFVKADGTYTFTSALVIALSSVGTPPYRWTGYKTTRTDGASSPLCANCPTWTTSTNNINIVQTSNTTVGNVEFDNIIFTNTAGTKGSGIAATGANGYNFLTQNCVFDGFLRAINGDFSTIFAFSPITISNTEIKNSTGDGIMNSDNVIVLGSYIHNNAGDGVKVSPNGDGTLGADVVAYSTIANNTGNGYEFTQGGSVRNNPFPVLLNSNFYTNGGDGLKVVGANGQSQPGLIWNAIFYGNTGWGIEVTNGSVLAPVSAYSNAYGSNGSGNLSGIAAGVGDVSLSANPFSNPGSNNFALNSTAGGGAALKAVGYPGVLPIGGTGFIDIGMLQSQASAGAGTTTSGFVQ